MKVRSTLVLLLAVAALGVFMARVALERPGTRAALMDAAYVAPFDPANAATIRVLEGADELVFERQPDGLAWRITRPIEDRAGRMQIQQVLSMLSAIPHREIIHDPTDNERSEFAISNPKMRVKIDDASGRRLVELLLGRETVLPGGLYLGVAGRDEVFVVDVGVRDIVNQPPDAYRDRLVTALDPDAIDKIVLGNRNGQIELVRRRGDWRIDRPVGARADSRLASEIARAAAGARVVEFVKDGAMTLSQMGLSEPAGTIALYEEGSDTPHLIQLGGSAEPAPATGEGEPDEQALVYARHPGRGAVYKLAAGLVEFTQLAPNQLRDRHLSRFLMDAVDRFELHPQNRPTIVFARKPESWDMLAPVAGPANSPQIMAALDLLRTTRVAAFAADSAGSLAAYGLDTPWLRVVVSSFVSENIPEAASGATPLADIAFGSYNAAHDGFHAMLADEPFVVVVPRTLTDSLPTSATRWQALEIFRDDPAAIESITLRSGDLEVRHQRDAGGLWSRDGEPVNPSAPIESCANTLARLRAALRIDPPEPPAARPLLVATFETAGRTRSVDVFQENADGFFPATADGGASFFLLSRPDFDALTAPLGAATTPRQPPESELR